MKDYVAELLGLKDGGMPSRNKKISDLQNLERA